jgi:hypothetical protein
VGLRFVLSVLTPAMPCRRIWVRPRPLFLLLADKFLLSDARHRFPDPANGSPSKCRIVMGIPPCRPTLGMQVKPVPADRRIGTTAASAVRPPPHQSQRHED